MSRGRTKKRPGFGQGKHRLARVQRFKAKHPTSDKVPCMVCGQHTSRCRCDGMMPDNGASTRFVGFEAPMKVTGRKEFLDG